MTQTLTFEEAMRELESIVRALEEGRASLDQAMASYERGIFLKNLCAARLNEARMKIEKIAVDDAGSVSAQPVRLGEGA